MPEKFRVRFLRKCFCSLTSMKSLKIGCRVDKQPIIFVEKNLLFAIASVKSVKMMHCISALMWSIFHRNIFTEVQEHELYEYLKGCSLIRHGLTPLKRRKLGYLLAVANRANYPNTWKISEAASRDWFCTSLKKIQHFPSTLHKTKLNFAQLLSTSQLCRNYSRIWNWW